MKILKIILIFLFSYTILKGQNKYAIKSQDSHFTLYSSVDTNLIKKFSKTFRFGYFKKENVLPLRKKLIPYLNQKDPYATYLYARTYDLFEFGLGNQKQADTALIYYTKAADMNFADAEMFLYKLYRYRFMSVMENDSLSYQYLKRAYLHGDSIMKSQVCQELAFDYGSNDSTDKFTQYIGANKDSCLWYLQQSVKFDPKNSSSLDYLGDIYEEKKMYDEAMNTFLKSDNEQMTLKVAKWLIEGDKVKKDVEKGLNMIYKVAEKVKQMEVKGDGYMGVTHPIHLLNDFFWCKKLITREQVEKYIIENWPCDP